MLEESIVKSKHQVKKVVKYIQPVKEGIKAIKLDTLDKSTVTVGTLVFDSDEDSQNRMVRAITVMNYKGITTILWKLADNTTKNVTLTQLNDALVAATTQQSTLWFN